MENREKQAIWYVYQLLDESMKPFYVGKGKGNRINAHENQAARGVCSKKCNKIRSIWASGGTVIKQRVAVFWDEMAAYDHETDLIDEIGLENLTNLMRGGAGGWERRVTERRARRGAEMSARECLEIIQAHSSLFAYWLRHSKGGELSAKVAYAGRSIRKTLHAAALSLVFNGNGKKLLEKAASDKANHGRLADLMRPYNVHLRFA